MECLRLRPLRRDLHSGHFLRLLGSRKILHRGHPPRPRPSGYLHRHGTPGGGSVASKTPQASRSAHFPLFRFLGSHLFLKRSSLLRTTRHHTIHGIAPRVHPPNVTIQSSRFRALLIVDRDRESPETRGHHLYRPPTASTSCHRNVVWPWSPTLETCVSLGSRTDVCRRTLAATPGGDVRATWRSRNNSKVSGMASRDFLYPHAYGRPPTSMAYGRLACI